MSALSEGKDRSSPVGMAAQAPTGGSTSAEMTAKLTL
jgi:hypothetical protein